MTAGIPDTAHAMPPRPITQQTAIFDRAATEASTALSKWLGRPTTITIRGVLALPLEEAVGVLGAADAILVACAMRLSGALEGVLVLACDDSSGLSLADLLLGRHAGGSGAWGEIETSAVVETANIIGCAYLNAVAAGDGDGCRTLLPSPPWFVRDYVGPVMEAIVMPQAMRVDEVFLTRTEFAVEDAPITCSLLFVPEHHETA